MTAAFTEQPPTTTAIKHVREIELAVERLRGAMLDGLALPITCDES